VRMSAVQWLQLITGTAQSSTDAPAVSACCRVSSNIFSVCVQNGTRSEALNTHIATLCTEVAAFLLSAHNSFDISFESVLSFKWKLNRKSRV
jgi:hypothetical protein